MTKIPLTWTTRRYKLKSLIEWDKNPVQISKREAQELSKSIDKFGHVIPYVAAAPPEEGKKGLPMLDGHQRKMCELQINHVSPDTLVDVRVPSRKLTEKEREELVIRLRKNVGEFDFDKLANNFEVADLLDWGFEVKELVGTGFTQGQDGFDFGGLPDQDRAPFRQVTFTLHDSQFEKVEEAIKKSKEMGEFTDSPNENSNGNALARICEAFLNGDG